MVWPNLIDYFSTVTNIFPIKFYAQCCESFWYAPFISKFTFTWRFSFKCLQHRNLFDNSFIKIIAFRAKRKWRNIIRLVFRHRNCVPGIRLICVCLRILYSVLFNTISWSILYWKRGRILNKNQIFCQLWNQRNMQKWKISFRSMINADCAR